ncbi:helix-turn-helix transcriptional regulator [Stenotrophomonas maltophilia]|uniref:helix-turn-helix domain-containing protein n=1 Tax=Stenotrophomonas maltophilia TaxID=40324 RepID=UPI00200BC0B0|nr:helix-turn-helix transcriptional regulator [Stenotrophomonas maltophilia]UQA69566.1 helix-turn-helix transcriptional regulator [Stenotrophomonas maltophilia]
MDPIAAIDELRAARLTDEAIASAVGVRQSTINRIRNGKRRPSYAVGKALVDLAAARRRKRRTTQPKGNASRPIKDLGPLLDSRMSKRALRARLGLSTDKRLATVLKLPIEQVEGWSEEGALPALPQIQRLLGVQEQPQAQPEPHDPDENRYAPLEVA